MKNHINLITDFGTKDHFAGVMSAVIYGINPDAQIVNTSHEIPPQSVESAAFVLLECFPYWSKGTIHVVVVDPEVGSGRSALAFNVLDQIVVGPDNGFIGYIADRFGVTECRKIENYSWTLPKVSKTFHGRDIFAPVAAHLSLGMPFSKVGSKVESFARLNIPSPKIDKGEIVGQVIYVDHFGNALTNIPFELIEKLQNQNPVAHVANIEIVALVPNFCHAEEGKVAMMASSGGWLELVCNKDSAARILSLSIADVVRISHQSGAMLGAVPQSSLS